MLQLKAGINVITYWLATWYGLSVSDTDFGGLLSDTAVLHFDTDFNYIYGDIIFNHIMYAS